MTTKNLTRDEKLRRKRWQWHQHLLAWEKSGLTQAEYCRQNSLSSKSFTYWKRKFKQVAGSTQLIPVPIHAIHPTNKQSHSAGLTLLLDKGFRVEIGEYFQPDTLVKLVRTLAAL